MLDDLLLSVPPSSRGSTKRRWVTPEPFAQVLRLRLDAAHERLKEAQQRLQRLQAETTVPPASPPGR